MPSTQLLKFCLTINFNLLDFNQARVGNKIEVYSRKLPHSRGEIELVKAEELTLPSEGQKVDFYHREFHCNGKTLKYHDEKIGSATVISLSLVGKDRKMVVKGNSQSSISSEKIEKISVEEAVKLQKNGL